MRFDEFDDEAAKRLFGQLLIAIDPRAKTARERRAVLVSALGAAAPSPARMSALLSARKDAPAPDAPLLEALDAKAREVRPGVSSAPSFSFIDLFAGIGGIRRAFEGIGGACVFTSEWNDEAVRTYVANHPWTHPIAGDIVGCVGDINDSAYDDPRFADLTRNSIPEHSVLLGGFPCQPFSLAGVSKKNAMGRAHGFDDKTQGTLFFAIKRILAVRQPACFMLENVKNIRSHDSGRTFSEIMRSLREDCGYEAEAFLVDAAHWLPTHRERTYFVGVRRDLAEADPELAEAWRAALATLSAKQAEGRAPDRLNPLRTILHSESDDRSSVMADAAAGYCSASGAVSGRYTLTEGVWRALNRHRSKHEAKGSGFGFGLFDGTTASRTLSARYGKDGAEILIRRSEEPDGTPRRLTPRECARLMGFDEPGNSSFVIPVSDCQAYRQFGNSVAIKAVEFVAEAMRPVIGLAVRRNGSAS